MGERPMGIEYHNTDAANYAANGNEKFDVVTALYLLCYADTRNMLRKYCQRVYKNVKKGGKFVTITPILDPNSQVDTVVTGVFYEPCPESAKYRTDGVKHNIYIYSQDMSSKVQFANYFWKYETVCEELYNAGFTSIKSVQIVLR